MDFNKSKYVPFVIGIWKRRKRVKDSKDTIQGSDGFFVIGTIRGFINYEAEDVIVLENEKSKKQIRMNKLQFEKYMDKVFDIACETDNNIQKD